MGIHESLVEFGNLSGTPEHLSCTAQKHNRELFMHHRISSMHSKESNMHNRKSYMQER
jgi:hypothetical protein